MTRPGHELGPLDPESGAVTTRSPTTYFCSNFNNLLCSVIVFLTFNGHQKPRPGLV